MKTYPYRSRPWLATGLLATTLIVGGCASSDNDDDDAVVTPTSQLRVIHASHDAPPVNLKLGGAVALADLDYAESTGFVDVPSGPTDIDVEAVIPGGNLDVIEIDGFPLLADQRYTVLAVNDTATIKELPVAETAADPAAGEVAIAVVHAATSAGLVDVYVTESTTDITAVSPNFTFGYEGVVDAGALPATTYRIRVTENTLKTPIFDSGPIDLAPFGGEKLLVVAIDSINDTEKAASDIKLLVATDSVSLVLHDSATAAGARVAHLSPDAGTLAGGPVEVFATSPALAGGTPTELIDAFEYTDIIPAADAFVGVPSGSYQFDVAPNTNSISDSVYTSPALPLAAGTEYSVIAAGNVGDAPPAPTAFGLLAVEEDNRPVVTQASVKVVHAAPAAGSVDIYVTPAGAFSAADVESGVAGDPLLDGFAFGAITADYVPVPPGDYDIRVVPEATGTTAINVEGLTLPAGLVATVVARQPDGDGTPNDFDLVLLTN